jgi:hypothetical protein
MVTLTTQSIGGTTTVTATSSLTAPVYFYWFAGGVFVGSNRSSAATPAAQWTFRPAAGEQLAIEVHDDSSSTYDPATFVSAAAPARRTLAWIRTTDATCTRYQLQQQQGASGPYAVGGGSWETIASVKADATWQYTFTTEPLEDLTPYAWRVVPLNSAGVAGTPADIPSEMIVRTPDAPPPTWFTVSAGLPASLTVTGGTSGEAGSYDYTTSPSMSGWSGGAISLWVSVGAGYVRTDGAFYLLQNPGGGDWQIVQTSPYGPGPLSTTLLGMYLSGSDGPVVTTP